MANLPEKNVVLVDKITNVPTDSNLFINANGEFKQASVNDVVNSSTVVSTAVETAINTAVQDSIDSNFKQTSGSPILLTDSADGTLIDFKAYGRSTQNGTPTPDAPIDIKSVGEGGSLEIKSIGKNLLKNTATTQSINGVTFAVNEDKSVTVNGTSNAWVNILLGSIKMTSNLTLSSETVGTSNGNAKIQFYNATKSLHIAELSNGSYEYDNSNGDIIEVWTGIAPSTTVNDLTFYPMIRKAEVTDDTYEPYKETVTYIPLNEPLRSSLDGSVTDEVSATKVTRRFAEVVFDGSDDEGWNLQAGLNMFYIKIDNSKVNSKTICDKYATYNYVLNMEYVNKSLCINVNKALCLKDTSKFTTLDELKTWLQANPIKVQYELAEPITETIEPVDIATYNSVTYITNADDAEMEIEYPTTKVAGIASIGYSKGIKAEYETEQLKKQLLEIQATIVNTL